LVDACIGAIANYACWRAVACAAKSKTHVDALIQCRMAAQKKAAAQGRGSNET
jgi:hypothetical protein